MGKNLRGSNGGPWGGRVNHTSFPPRSDSPDSFYTAISQQALWEILRRMLRYDAFTSQLTALISSYTTSDFTRTNKTVVCLVPIYFLETFDHTVWV